MECSIQRFDSQNPATEQVIWTGEQCSESTILDVVRLAKVTQTQWNNIGLESRKEIIRKFAQLVKENSDEAARIIAEENGKPLWEAKTEVNSLINKVQVGGVKSTQFTKIADSFN